MFPIIECGTRDGIVKEQFGVRLKELRTLRGMTQAELAEGAGVSVEYVGRLERGLSSPSFAVMEGLSDTLCVCPASLFLFREEMDTEKNSRFSSHSQTSNVEEMFATLPLTCGVWWKDFRHDREYWSDTLYGLLGYTEEERPEPGFAAFLDRVHPGDKERVRDIDEGVHSGAIPGNVSFRVVAGDGAPRSLLVHFNVVKEEDGRPLSGCVLFLDATDLIRLQRLLLLDREQLRNLAMASEKEAERARRLGEASSKRFELAMEAVRDGVWDWNLATGEVYFSPGWYAMLEYEPESLPTRYETWASLLHPWDRSRVESEVRASLVSGKDFDMEFRMRTRTGGWKWIHGRGGVVERGPDGCSVRAVGTHTDISERKRSRELQAEISQVMQHNLKTPLSGILCLPQVMMQDNNLTLEQKSDLGLMAAAGERMLRTINAYGAMSKIESGFYCVAEEDVDLLEVLDLAALDLAALIRTKNVGLNIQQPGKEDQGRPVVKADPDLTYTILSNLLKNAVEASPSHGTVTVSLSHGNSLHLSIRNQGVVPEDIRDRFFEKYMTSGKRNGSGIGAYSAKMMAGLQNWKLEMRTSEEQGTELVIIIPC